MDSNVLTTPRKFVFLGLQSINKPINKKYRILPFSQQIIGNENKVFDLIYLLGNNKKNYIQLKDIYEKEQYNLRQQIIKQKSKKKIYENSNIINISNFDIDKINIHSPISIMEGNFITGLIQYCKNRKKRIQKMIEYKKKNKFVFKRPKITLSQNSALHNYLTKKNLTKYNNNDNNPIKNLNNPFEENKSGTSSNLNSFNNINDSDYENNSHKNTTKYINSYNENNKKFSNINIFINDDSKDKPKNTEFRRTINTIFSRTYNKLNKEMKSQSENNVFDIQNKRIKLHGTKEVKLKLKHKKLSKLFFSTLFKEENNIVKNLKNINNDLIDFKYTTISNNIKSIKQDTNNNDLYTPTKTNYKNLRTVLKATQKNIYRTPQVNKYIYGSRYPLTISNNNKIKSKIKLNLQD